MIDSDKKRKIAPVVAGVLVLLVATISGEYLEVYWSALILIIGAVLSEVICRKFFGVGFFREVVPPFLLSKDKKE